MSYPIKYPTPQGANVQIFSQGGSTSSWTKPQGASFVWFTLIGAGGGGGAPNGTNDGGAGGGATVTNFMCPAFLIPDTLQVIVGLGGAQTTVGTPTQIVYQQKNTTGYQLLVANGGNNGTNATSTTNGASGTGGATMTANYFTAMGFFYSVGGQDGTQDAPLNTFVGSGSALSNKLGLYGYAAGTNGAGFSQFSPIIVSLGQSESNGSTGATGAYRPGFGAGAGGSINGAAANFGGHGLAVIITW